MENIIRLYAKQSWISFSLRDRVVRKFCNPDVACDKEFEADFFDLKYKGNINSYLDWCVYFYGAYERENLSLYRDIVTKKTNPVFLDIGANVGHHSLFMSKYCDAVHSFEPNPFVRSRIDEKITLNSIDNIFVHDIGLGQYNDELPFFYPKGCNQGTGSFVKDYSENNKECGKLKVVNADNYISKLELNNIDLIKIDVEGFEKNVLIGLKKTIEMYKPTVIVEFSETTRNTFKDVNEFFGIFPGNYKVNKILCNRSRYFIFNSSQYIFENFDFEKSGGDLIFSPT